MTAVYWTLSIVLVVALVAAAGQQYRYLRARRSAVADRQELLYPSSAFHVVTVVALSPGQELLSGVRGLLEAHERAGAKTIYAGQIAVNAMPSSQIPQADWDAFVLVQYPTRNAYETVAASPDLQKVRAGFASSYALGMQRSPWLNLALPVLLLGRRAVDIVTRRPARYPFEPAGDPASLPAEAQERRAHLVGGLLAHREYGKDACVVLNFMKSGSAEQQQANSGYGAAMMGMMAELGIGPMHMGGAVTLEGDADFDQVAIVYYPGVEFFAEMVQSTFFTGIVGGKQLGDTLSSPTVPLLPHL